MSNNKFDALGSDESEGDEAVNNHQQLEVCFKALPNYNKLNGF